MTLGYAAGAFTSQQQTFVEGVLDIATFAFVIMSFAVLPILFLSVAGLLLYIGYAGWASATLLGGLITGLFGVIVMRDPAWASLGAIYGFAFWVGIAILCPQALRTPESDSPDTRSEPPLAR